MSYLHFILTAFVSAQGKVRHLIRAQEVPVGSHSFLYRSNFTLFTHRHGRRT